MEGTREKHLEGSERKEGKERREKEYGRGRNMRGREEGADLHFVNTAAYAFSLWHVLHSFVTAVLIINIILLLCPEEVNIIVGGCSVAFVGEDRSDIEMSMV